MRFAGEFEPVQNRGGNDDRRAMLIVVKDRDRHAFLELALDLETFRRLDVFEIDAAEGRLQRGDDFDETVDIGLRHFNVEDVDAGEFLEENRLAFHHRLCGERPDRAEARAPPCHW